MVKGMLRLLYPPKCVFCDKVVENERFSVCDDCLSLVPYNHRACSVCGTPMDTVYGDLLCPACRKKRRKFKRVYVPFIYKDAVRDGILGLKFRGRKGRSTTFAAFIFLKLKEEKAPRPDLITYMPMHFIRLGKRGYNQAQLIAKALGEMMGVPTIKTLRKIKHTKPQSKLQGQARRHNLEGAIKPFEPENFIGKTVLLIDDVTTTGTSLETCAKELRYAGAKEVYAATVAATPFHH